MELMKLKWSAACSCSQFSLAREIHAKETRMRNRRRRYADMHFQGTRIAKHTGENLERCPADNRILHDTHALVLEHAFDGVFDIDLVITDAKVLADGKRIADIVLLAVRHKYADNAVLA